ncbi:PspA/IM30 family protein [Aliiroseovarius sp. KMU-50]|uniref:PspA/IM30 family protein n=1 Tax=Aliiroseovarius salicola TaxID=3009082 RepID=A0ABT4W5T5_9RHOB|nr:PspA/IM30 family protein [Aliiroseovarius sp. KMU-50]MDA5095856.1 PspA/IM30 family protein [Aliiroseovarius sp. KMU-50]
MFKMITTLIRSHSHDTVEDITDANALQILRQQLRDAAVGLEKSKRAVAVVMAYAERERKSAIKLEAQLADLEVRALDAIVKEREDLAMEAASAIADLEAEHTACRTSITHYDGEISRLRDQVSLAEQRLRALQRGKQIADAAQRTQELRGTMPDGVLASLKEAEATLERLQNRQSHAEQVELALTEVNASSSAEATSARLAAAGCGAPLRAEAADVMARLKAKTATSS